MKVKHTYVFAVIGLLLLAAAPIAFAQSQSVAWQLAQVRRATARYHDLNVAALDGYVQFLNCLQMPGQGAMGVHFVNGTLAGDVVLDPLRPEAVIYEPRGRQMALVAVEYVVMADAWKAAGHTSPPSLFGQTFNFNDSPNMFGLPPFYALHAWIWKPNPSGTFASWNPVVSCPTTVKREPMGTAR